MSSQGQTEIVVVSAPARDVVVFEPAREAHVVALGQQGPPGIPGMTTVADITDLGALVADFLRTPSSANLFSALTTKAGGGTVVFSDSPGLTGTPTAPTAAQGTNTTQIATTAYVRAEISALVASSPASLDTLNELAAALGSDPNFATTVTNALALKAPIASPSFTGTVTLPQFALAPSGWSVASSLFVLDNAGRTVGVGGTAVGSPFQVRVAGAAAGIYDDDTIGVGKGGELRLQHRNSSGNPVSYAALKASAVTGSAGIENGDLLLKTMTAGVLTTRLQLAYDGNHVLTGNLWPTGNFTFNPLNTDTSASTTSLFHNPIYTTGSGRTVTSKIEFVRPSTVSGNYAGYLSFWTRANGSALAETMRLNDAGRLLLGETDNTLDTVQVRGSIYVKKISAYPELTLEAVTTGFPIINLLAAGSSDSYITFNNGLKFGSNATRGGAFTQRALLTNTGRFIVGSASDDTVNALQVGGTMVVSGDNVRIATAATPASAAATGSTGMVKWDSSYIYVCTASNTWKRAALATW